MANKKQSFLEQAKLVSLCKESGSLAPQKQAKPSFAVPPKESLVKSGGDF
jgi:hypothetical protein